MPLLVLLPLRRGNASARLCLQSIELLVYALSHLLCLDECCSVSLLVSTSFVAAKLHHIAEKYILPTGEHSRSSLAKYVPWYLLSPFFLFCLFPLLSATLGPTFDMYEMTTLARLPFRLSLGRVIDTTGYLQTLCPIYILSVLRRI